MLADAFLRTPRKNGVYFVAAAQDGLVFRLRLWKSARLIHRTEHAARGLSVPADETPALVAQRGEKHSEIMITEPQK